MSACRIDGKSKYFVLNDRKSWEAGLFFSTRFSGQGLKIRQVDEYIPEQVIPGNELQTVPRITGFATGKCSQIFMLDKDTPTVWIYDFAQKQFERIDCIRQILTKAVKAVTYLDGLLIVADSQADFRLAAFTEINWQVKWTVGSDFVTSDDQVEIKDFKPVALTIGNKEEFFALDTTSKLIIKFDKIGQPLRVFGTDEHLSALLQDPVALAHSEDGFLFVLDWRSGSDPVVWKFSAVAANGSPPPQGDIIIEFQSLTFEIEAGDIAVDSIGRIFIGDRRSLASGSEDDRFIRLFNAEGNYLGEVSGYRGAADKLIVDAQNRIYVFSAGSAGEECAISILKPQKFLAKYEGDALPRGTYFSAALDSTELQTCWHKFIVDAEIPENTQMFISYFASDEQTLLVDGQPVDLAALFQCDAVPTPEQVAALEKLNWSQPFRNAADAFISGASGRYLWLKIELTGSPVLSPLVRSVAVYFPRATYLRYLPAVYQEDAAGRKFLERFLSVFETLMQGVEQNIDHVVKYFDVDAVEEEFLGWLSGWLAVSVDENWSSEQVRTLMREAPLLYKKRGTREGLERLIEIFSGSKPLIIENFQLGCSSPAFSEIEKKQDIPLRKSCVDVEGYLKIETTVPVQVYPDQDLAVKLVVKPLPALFRLIEEQLLIKVEIIEAITGNEESETKRFELRPEDFVTGKTIDKSFEVEVLNRTLFIEGKVIIWVMDFNIDEVVPVERTLPLVPVMVRKSFRRVLEILFGTDPYRFCVLLKPFPVKLGNGTARFRRITESEHLTVKRIIEQEKPAHTQANLQIMQPWIYLDGHTYLGMNTYLSKPSPQLEFGSALPRDTVLGEASKIGRIDSKSRVNLDLELE